MKMPAKSVMDRLIESKRLDQIAIPLIASLGIAEAYRAAILECDAMAAERFPVTRKEPPFRLTPPSSRSKF